MKAIILTQAIAIAMSIYFLVDEEKAHDKTKAELNSYKVKLFESAYRLNKCEGEE
jgi:hypothetical protein